MSDAYLYVGEEFMEILCLVSLHAYIVCASIAVLRSFLHSAP
jgi:hypothetical protein